VPGNAPGTVALDFREVAGRTVLARAFARSPARLLTPRNHGGAAWVYLASLGGGLLDADCIDVRMDVGAGASALLGTQASTKVYRSARGASQRLDARVGTGALLALVPDPVVCFRAARYEQHVRVELCADSSFLMLDGYTAGRSGSGERWQFDAYASRTVVVRGAARLFVDATRLDPEAGPLPSRMGEFDAILSLFAAGPRLATVRAAMVASAASVASGAGRRSASGATRSAAPLMAASPVGEDAVVLRVAARRFEDASRALRPSFAALAQVLGDDPFARKW
jgi:urease accessory protein